MSDTQRRYGDGELIALLQIITSDYNKIPTQREILSDNRLPTHHTYNKRFGSITNALKLAGMDDIECDNTLHKTVGGLLKSSNIDIIGEYSLIGAVLVDFIVNINETSYLIDLISISGMNDDDYSNIKRMRKMMVDGHSSDNYLQFDSLVQVVQWMNE